MFEKCSCSHCSRYIEFDASHVGQMVACPHCGLETELFVPLNKTSLPLPSAPKDVRIEIKRGVSPFGIASLVLGGIMVCFLSIFIALTARTTWSKSSVVRQGDTEVTLDTVRIGQAMQGGVRITTESYLYIHLVVENLSTTKKIACKTWRGSNFESGKDAATVTDNYRNNYEQKTPPRALAGYEDEKTIYPKMEFSDVLYFEVPVKKIRWLHLELPAENFGGKGMIRFEISTNDIEELKYEPPQF